MAGVEPGPPLVRHVAAGVEPILRDGLPGAGRSGNMARMSEPAKRSGVMHLPLNRISNRLLRNLLLPAGPAIEWLLGIPRMNAIHRRAADMDPALPFADRCAAILQRHDHGAVHSARETHQRQQPRKRGANSRGRECGAEGMTPQIAERKGQGVHAGCPRR